MLICHCQVVNDSRVRAAVVAGARTVGQVGKACGAGTCCGGCVPAIVSLVSSELEKEAENTTDKLLLLPIAAE